MAVDTVIGAPAWDRAWCFPLWMASVRANVDPDTTGLVFVVPAADTATRTAITRLTADFNWVEVIRDRGVQLPRDERPGEKHRTLATARNQILQIVAKVRPKHYLSWDTDLLVPPGTVDRLEIEDLPIVTVWTWLNRMAPRRINHYDGHEYREVLWQPPVCATAMAWDPHNNGRAMHYPAEEFQIRSSGLWRCGVAAAFKLMDKRAYSVAHYLPHHDGEDIPFNAQLAQRGVPRFCAGDIRGLHLYDRGAREEWATKWPNVMNFAKQVPLAASWTGDRSPEYQAFGFFEAPRDEVDQEAA